MAGTNGSSTSEFNLIDCLKSMLRAAMLSLGDANSASKGSSAEKAALARVGICLVRAYAELNALETSPSQSLGPIGTVLPFVRGARDVSDGRETGDVR